MIIFYFGVLFSIAHIQDVLCQISMRPTIQTYKIELNQRQIAIVNYKMTLIYNNLSFQLKINKLLKLTFQQKQEIMGTKQSAQSNQQQSAQQIIKHKQQIQFKQNDFIRQIQGSIELQYEILSPYLRQNQFYELRKVIHRKTKLIRSVYIINKYKFRTKERQFLKDQIDRLKKIDHPNVNKIYELFKDSHQFFIVMELCYGECLASMLERQGYISQKRAAHMMFQMFNVLGHCHRKGIQHTDLKLQNVVFNSQKQDIIKIVDFSISRIFRVEDIIEQSKGKAFLSSPESLNNQNSPKSDIWQCGMILYMLLCGEAPILGTKKNKLAKKVLYYMPNFLEKRFQGVSKQGKQFIRSLLRLNPNDRPTAEQCLQSIWIKKFYKEPIISAINLKRCLMQCYHFNPLSKLQQATWTFFVNALVPFSQKQNILYVFNNLDKKNKGELGFGQIFEGFNLVYDQNQQKAQFLTEFLFRRLRRQKITFSNFLTIATNRIFLITDSNIKKIFSIFDEDDSGQISVVQLKQVLGSSKQVTEQIWLELMKEADANSDGMISFEEFRDIMKSLLSKENEELFEQEKNRKQQFNHFSFQAE